jgi:hypothetical protein
MTLVKRWAFLPLLLLVCVWAGFALTGNDVARGVIVALGLTLLIAPVWDRRRRGRR